MPSEDKKLPYLGKNMTLSYYRLPLEKKKNCETYLQKTFYNSQGKYNFIGN
jgi:hypothetical protein